jgi:hypothetical protein
MPSLELRNMPSSKGKETDIKKTPRKGNQSI